MERPYKVAINNQAYSFERDNCVVHMYRDEPYQDMDFVRYYDRDTEEGKRIYGLPYMARWMAGIAFKGNGTLHIPLSTENRTFYDHYGWNADVIMADSPEPEDMAGWIRINIDKDIDKYGAWKLPDGEE
jgi:hypothetical protein